MSHPEHTEEEVLLKDKVRVRSEQLSNIISTFFDTFKWACTVLVLVLRIAGLFMFIIWASDCFIREFQTTALCKEFSIFPIPKIFASARLFLCGTTSFLLILHIRRLNHFPGFREVLKHLVWKKYFWKLVVVLILVCIYDIIIILKEQETLKTLLYSLYIFEKSLGVALVLFLNFLPSDASDLPQKKRAIKFWLYIGALVVYAFEGYVMFILGSIIAVHNVLSVPKTTEDTPDTTAVAGLILLMTNNALRYYLAEFFSSKCFNRDVDILGGGTQSILKSLAQKGYRGAESEEASGRVTTTL